LDATVEEMRRHIREVPGLAQRGLFPRETISTAYELEYGQNSLGIHADSIPEGARVLDGDGVLATGGTARAMCQLVQNAGGRRLI
jgi:adenine phosphoribosyltransferase